MVLYMGLDVTKPVFRVSENQSVHLQRLASKLEILIVESLDTIQEVNKKGADQTAQMRSLVCAFVVRKSQKTCFLASRPMCGLVCDRHVALLVIFTSMCVFVFL